MKLILMNRWGYTLVEILIAITLMIVGIGLFINAFMLGLDGIVAAQDRIKAANYAQEVMEEEIMDKSFEDLTIGTTTLSDIGDYSRQYKVFYVESTDLDTEVAGPTDYKRVEVSVSDKHSPERFQTVEFVTIRSSY